MPTITPVARPGWSGVEKFDFEFPASELARLIKLIPIARPLDQTEAKIRTERLSISLIGLRARFQRHLHQDEFGPRRRDQAEGLRVLEAELEELAREAGSETLNHARRRRSIRVTVSR